MVRLARADCRNFLRTLSPESVDCIISDPPYKLSSGGRKNTKLRAVNETPFSQSGECFASKTPPFSSWIPLLFRALRSNGYMFLMVNDRNLRDMWAECEKAGFIFCQLLVMSKQNAVCSTYFYKSCEFILLFRKGGYQKFHIRGHKSVMTVRMPRGKQKSHPTEKPYGLFYPLLESCSLPGEVVLDPFMGSGSVGEACLRLGRSFIGCEIDPVYYARARDRIKNLRTAQHSANDSF